MSDTGEKITDVDDSYGRARYPGLEGWQLAGKMAFDLWWHTSNISGEAYNLAKVKLGAGVLEHPHSDLAPEDEVYRELVDKAGELATNAFELYETAINKGRETPWA